jgi:adenylosuccinate lyase
MISRYAVQDISKIWTDHYKFECFLKVELAVIESLENGVIPPGTAKKIKNNVKINPQRIQEIEKATKHDVIAFCSSITEQIPAEIGKYFHFGVTSSDIIDTALSLQIKSSLECLIPRLEKLCSGLKARAQEFKDVVCMGRSHGMNAEPTSFGLKFLSAYSEFDRRLVQLRSFYSEELTGQISGAVGNYTLVNTQIEKEVMTKLGLSVETVSTQVIPRDRIAHLVSIGALIAGAIERLATEMRLLHHSDVAEINEGFAPGQKGSSIMPHKKNPVSAENLTGIARMLRGHLTPVQENTILWHERDISHSSVERMILPDHLGLLAYALDRLNSTIENLVVHREKIEQKVLKEFSYLSSYFLHRLIQTTDRNRDELYPIIQQAAFQSNSKAQFTSSIEKQCHAMNISIDIPEFDLTKIRELYLSQVEQIFQRALQG